MPIQVRAHNRGIIITIHEVINYIHYYNIYCHVTHLTNLNVRVSSTNTIPVSDWRRQYLRSY